MIHGLDNAEKIRHRILTAPVADELKTLVNLTQVPVIVYQQQALDSELKAVVGKGFGAAITIEWDGFITDDEDAEAPALRENYSIKVWSKPIISGGNYPAELVLKSIVLRLWGWIPNGSHSTDRARPKNGGVTPSKSYLIYDCEVSVPIYL